MRYLNPVVMLLSVICLAVGVLIYCDSSAPVVAQASGSLKSVAPLPGYLRTADEKPSPNVAMAENLTGEHAAASSPQVPAESTRTLSLHVSGLKHESSTLYVAVFDSAEGFPKPEHSKTTTKIPITSDSVDFSLSLPEVSTTGIAVFQDLNGDGRLTKNGFGLPTEPYGFSNNARSAFGPPSFSAAAFRLSESMSSMEISVR